MNNKTQTKLLKLFKDLINFYNCNINSELSLDDKPFANFLEALFQISSNHQNYCDDFMYDFVIHEVEACTKSPNELTLEDINSLQNRLYECFNENAIVHFLILPLSESGLEQDIRFGDFSFLIAKDTKTILKQISMITKVKYDDVKTFLTHTQRSRSPDFLKYNLLIIKMKMPNPFLYSTASEISRYILYIIKLIYLGNNLESSILRKTKSFLIRNNYVAFISNDPIKCGHRKLTSNNNCNIDLDFMVERKYQKILTQLYSSFIFERNQDELTTKFLNSLILFSKGQEQIEQDKSLSLLLYLTAAESLLTEGKNEKSLRLSAILSRLVETDNTSTFELASLIKQMYLRRNDFVHAGINTYFHYEDKSLEKLQIAVAKMILKYLDINDILSLSSETTRIAQWRKYIDDLFDNIIFGVSVK